VESFLAEDHPVDLTIRQAVIDRALALDRKRRQDLAGRIAVEVRKMFK
jgi:hypothetical protein